MVGPCLREFIGIGVYAFKTKEVRLFLFRHEDFGVLPKKLVKSSGSGLACANDDEIRPSFCPHSFDAFGISAG